ncbi:toxin-antitoxin system YwqK family antitoxin [Chryseolinea soli]|uniref:Toxin-antitoxin system YwqK family antitoxin n=1 Tax=Chryseolinea soli TaxID=2321403 RepID=A0A385SQW0_9BACT|nr:toxin-antitoxin system YwqK family antitoxin [Chryseolinea soli]AYB33539.1 toxin-antitoxin system YwqK family antitoxin [Chryseolinea soli]
MMSPFRLTVIFLLTSASVMAQSPRYATKHLLSTNDGTFKDFNAAKKNGKVVSYLETNAVLWDIDDDNTTVIKISGPTLLCFEGTWKNGKKEGQVNVYVIDSVNRQRRYKIWEQQYQNDHLNGEWREYTLRGTLASLRTFQNDSLQGIAREYWIDGTIKDEREYLGSSQHYIEHTLRPDGTLEKILTIRNGQRNGVGREYYPDGKVMEEVNFKDDNFHGPRKYFYPNGQLWIEQIDKDGLQWEVVSNFTEDGKRRDAGTLRNGNGTIIFYNENGSVRKVSTFLNGVEQ